MAFARWSTKPRTWPAIHPHTFNNNIIIIIIRLGSRGTYFVKYPSAEHGLYRVIDNEYFSELKRFTVFHQSGSQRFGEIRVKQTYEQRRERTGQHRPTVYSGVCNYMKKKKY